MIKGLMTRRTVLTAAAGLGGVIAMPSLLRAASYATQPIRLFVGTAAAGTNDLVARLIAPIMKDELGQPVLIENRPGAATTLAVSLVANAKPDGHTLLVSSGAALAVHAVSITKPASLLDDLSHIAMLADGDYLYAVNANVPAQNVEEFVALLKKEPGKIRYGGTGPGGTVHLSGELLALRTGTKMTVVHYTNAGQRANDLLANQIQLGIGGSAVLGQHIRSGALRGLLVAGTRRDAQFPDLPTSSELGFKDLDGITNWFALHGPKGMPDDINRQINAAARKALANPEVQKLVMNAGMVVAASSPEELTARMRKDDALIRDVAKSANIRVE